VAAFGAPAAVAEAATVYLTISIWGLPAMLLVLAATGLMRGLHDVRTPLVIVGIGFAANAVPNAIFIYGLGLGIAGSAIGAVADVVARRLAATGEAAPRTETRETADDEEQRHDLADPRGPGEPRLLLERLRDDERAVRAGADPDHEQVDHDNEHGTEHPRDVEDQVSFRDVDG
jgi:hypothetical protein